MSTLKPRIVLVTRQTELQALLLRHGTRGQVEFYLSSRGQAFAEVEARDQIQSDALVKAKAAVPEDWSFVHVDRADLNRFLFFPNDIVVAIGQDGLVANLAKYLNGQPVLGVSPSADMSEGILTPHSLHALPSLVRRAGAGDVDTEHRAMVAAKIDGGDRLLALNELFIGHRSHQSARYEVTFDDAREFQSSSGLIVATGTGLSGWARSIMTSTQDIFEFSATEEKAAFFAREPWPSRQSGATLRSGLIRSGTSLEIVSHINQGGVIFADGIEQDFLSFDWGASAHISLAEERLTLVQ